MDVEINHTSGKISRHEYNRDLTGYSKISYRLLNKKWEIESFEKPKVVKPVPKPNVKPDENKDPGYCLRWLDERQNIRFF